MKNTCPVTSHSYIHTKLGAVQQRNEYQQRNSLDFLDSFHALLADVATPELVVLPVEAALVRVAESLRADLSPSAWLSVRPQNIAQAEK